MITSLSFYYGHHNTPSFKANSAKIKISLEIHENYNKKWGAIFISFIHSPVLPDYLRQEKLFSS